MPHKTAYTLVFKKKILLKPVKSVIPPEGRESKRKSKDTVTKENKYNKIKRVEHATTINSTT
jgi:hypothetical protein